MHTIETPAGPRRIASLPALMDHLGHDLGTMPFSMRVLLEACLRHCDGETVTQDDVVALASYDASQVAIREIPFQPGRVVLQDFTGVPAMVDLAAMRSAMVDMTGTTAAADRVNPLVPCDLVIDHSVQVDAFNSGVALAVNAQYEFTRNKERYEFLKWGQQAFDNFRVVPPATGIVHQVNLEYLAKVVWDDGDWLYPDSLVGTDSHTTMINGLGVLGWGVGGIEAEACMLGQPISMLIPEVVGMRLTGRIPEGCTATDLVLRITQLLREHGVVGKFVEFFGSGLVGMPLATRATIANMAPEYGATMGFFPVDGATLRYLELTGRDEALIAIVEQYCKANGFWHSGDETMRYSAVVQLDLGTIEPAMAGPKRPQDRILLSDMKSAWRAFLASDLDRPEASVLVECEDTAFELKDGAVVIAAITSCTNTSNPDVMVAAGLVARKARAAGLNRQPWVKTSLAPGSKVVTEYLKRSELLEDLEAVGFFTVGYGCTTCIGNSGPLPAPIHDAIETNDLIATSVLSGNRNFEGRINSDVRANYLASPPLVVAYALVGTVDIDLASEPLGQDLDGQDVYLRDIWPTQVEIDEVVAANISPDQFLTQYADVFTGSDAWRDIRTGDGKLFEWSDTSTYIHLPPFFEGMTQETPGIPLVQGARVLCLLGDSVTTDHISPAGSIGVDSPAGQWLTQHGVEPGMFNSFGSRRGNDLVMTRGTFGNIRVRNQLAPGTEGGWTTDFTSGTVTSIFEASEHYRAAGTPLVVLAGKEYGMGSSRDWAAKGTFLLGVRAVIAESYERIHRSNLVGMGVVPLEFMDGQSVATLGLSGSETFDIDWGSEFAPRQTVTVRATSEAGDVTTFEALLRVDTPIEVTYIQNGGILHTVLRRMAAAATAPSS
jgi:aconitate hydratase